VCIQQWMRTAVDVLSAAGSLDDHRFVLAHALRCRNVTQWSPIIRFTIANSMLTLHMQQVNYSVGQAPEGKQVDSIRPPNSSHPLSPNAYSKPNYVPYEIWNFESSFQ